MTDKQRRKFLLGLASLPFVPLFVEKVAKAALAEPKPPLVPLPRAKFEEMEPFGTHFTFEQGFAEMEGDEPLGLLFQCGRFDYRQAVMRDEHNNYYGGPTRGTLDLDRVIAPRLIWDKFVEQFGDIMKPSTLSFTYSGARRPGGPNTVQFRYRAENAVISHMGCSVAAGAFAATESVQLVFTNLVYEGELDKT